MYKVTLGSALDIDRIDLRPYRVSGLTQWLHRPAMTAVKGVLTLSSDFLVSVERDDDKTVVLAHLLSIDGLKQWRSVVLELTEPDTAYDSLSWSGSLQFGSWAHKRLCIVAEEFAADLALFLSAKTEDQSVANFKHSRLHSWH